MASKLDILKKKLVSGRVYRRYDIERWTNAVDRHLKQLLKDGLLIKLSGGIYYCPKKTSFGNLPPDEKELIKVFLRDYRFLLLSPNVYNTLGVGTTQLYNETIVYNHKRHGRFKLGGRIFNFRMKHFFPEQITTEFLLVDLVNNVDSLAEDRNKVFSSIRKKIRDVDVKLLLHVVKDYGSIKAKKFFEPLLG